MKGAILIFETISKLSIWFGKDWAVGDGIT